MPFKLPFTLLCLIVSCSIFFSAVLLAEAQPFFEDVFVNLPPASQSCVDTADFDADGDLDLLMSGSFDGRIRTRVFINTKIPHGKFGFEEIGSNLVGALCRSASWGDFDGDGDQDILLNGLSESAVPITKVYRTDIAQDGTISFIEIAPGILPGVLYGTADWGDYDRDGDLDILLTGATSGGNYIAAVFRTEFDQSGSPTFVDAGANLPDVALFGSASWGDYNSDNRLDILLSGVSVSGPVTKIFRQSLDVNGEIVFTDASIPIVGPSPGSCLWADLENDGDLDLVMIGFFGGFGNLTKIYLSSRDLSGDVIYTELTHQLPGGYNGGGVSLADYDGDADLDLFFTSSNSSGAVSKLFTTQVSNSGGISFSENPQQFVGLAGGSSTWGDYDLDGKLDLIHTGTSLDNSFHSIYYRASVDPAGNPYFTNIASPFIPVRNASVAWSDFDRDGKSDLLITGLAPSSNPVSKIYRSLSSNSFLDYEAPLIGTYNGSAGWGDLDGDGDPDLCISGLSVESFVSRIYTNSIGVNGKVEFSELVVPQLNNPLSGSLDWGDFDSDGDSDLLISGVTESGERLTKVYRGGVDVNGNPELIELPTSLVGVQHGEWGDFDSDGDLDIVLAGLSNSGPVAKIYRTEIAPDGGVSFVDLNASIAPLSSGFVSWCDLEGDGYLDLLISGNSSSGPATKLYRSSRDLGGNLLFSELATPFVGVYQGAGACADLDRDGDSDILLTGTTELENGSSQYVAKIYRTDLAANGDLGFAEVSSTLRPVTLSAIDLADYDGDGDLDIALAGLGSLAHISTIYKNLTCEQPGSNCACSSSSPDADNDGTADCLEQCPSDPLKTSPGICGCGVSDNDSDGDLTPDCQDTCPLDAQKVAPLVCGCGIAETDTDGDGTPNCIDSCPTDPSKILPGICGCLRPDSDNNNNGVVDCREPNTAPQVSAGADKTTTLTQAVILNGVATDDGNPFGTLAFTWTKRSGPGVVTFGSPTAETTTATFSKIGLYELQLRVSDQKLSATSKVRVQVNGEGLSQQVVGFSLISNATGLPVPGFEVLDSSKTVSLSQIGSSLVNILALSNPSAVGSVVIDVNGAKRTDNAAPYTAFSINWKPKLGVNHILATPYSLASAKGTKGEALLVSVTVVP